MMQNHSSLFSIKISHHLIVLIYWEKGRISLFSEANEKVSVALYPHDLKSNNNYASSLDHVYVKNTPEAPCHI